MLYLFNQNYNTPQLDYTPYYRTLIQEVQQAPSFLPPNYQTFYQRIQLRNQIEQGVNRTYHDFLIPKRSGGFRTISAPNDDLKQIQRKCLELLVQDSERRLPIVHAHDCAYAYIKNRSPKQAMVRHQRNNSRWFLKLDLKEFFPSCTRNWLTEILQQIYPINLTEPAVLQSCIDIFLKDDALPQGAPSSPMLSNLCMIPVDKKLAALLYSKGFIYTRYADDMLISHQYDFDYKDMLNQISAVLDYTPFRLNEDKTRYGSSSGRNWNLGLMLNKDNQLTIGHKRKERLRAALYQFMSDPESWEPAQIYALQGMLSYFENIEPETKRQMVTKYEQKFNRSLKELLI